MVLEVLLKKQSIVGSYCQGGNPEPHQLQQRGQHWAEWIAWQLEENGYQTVIQARDFLPGENFVLGIYEAARETRSTILVLSYRDFHIGILFGESGCGRSSFVQAGLRPMLPQFSPSHYPLYVKFSELDSLVSLRPAFKEQLQSSPPDLDNVGILRLCEQAAQIHAQAGRGDIYGDLANEPQLFFKECKL